MVLLWGILQRMKTKVIIEPKDEVSIIMTDVLSSNDRHKYKKVLGYTHVPKKSVTFLVNKQQNCYTFLT